MWNDLSELTEPSVARTITDVLPQDANLVLSSSMPVRDVEWFSAPRCGMRVLSNRGVNGIDGVVSTAVGVAAQSGRVTALLIGDIALLRLATKWEDRPSLMPRWSSCAGIRPSRIKFSA